MQKVQEGTDFVTRTNQAKTGWELRCCPTLNHSVPVRRCRQLQGSEVVSALGLCLGVVGSRAGPSSDAEEHQRAKAETD